MTLDDLIKEFEKFRDDTDSEIKALDDRIDNLESDLNNEIKEREDLEECLKNATIDLNF